MVFRRLPAWTRHQISDIQLALMVTMPGDHNLHLINGLDLFGPEDVSDLYDGLHPTADANRRIGERFHAIALASDS